MSYTYDYIERAAEAAKTYCNTYTSTEVDNNWAYTYSAYAYLSTYVHFSPREYWGSITSGNVYSLEDDTYPNNGTTGGTPGGTTGDNKNQCSPGCTCGQ